MDNKSNSLNWFEIPALDISRAKNFYENIFFIRMTDVDNMMGMTMSSFPSVIGSGKAHGGLVQSQMHKPSADGTVIYLNANPKIQNVIDRIEKAGGQVLIPKTLISPEIGYMAFFIDTEGNKIGLHAEG